MRYFMGYLTNVREIKKQFEVTIPALKINKKSDSLGAAIREAIFEQSSLLSNLKQPVPLPDYKDDFYYKIQLQLSHTNNLLLKYGFCCIIGDYVSQATYSEIEKILSEAFLGDKDYNVIETEIANKLINYLMLPSQRALMMTSLIMKTEHVSNFSHIIENAYFRLMHHDFISVVMTLTPVIEGILLDFLGFDINDNLPKKNKIYNKILSLKYDTDSKQMTHPYIFDEYLRSLVLFLDTVFYDLAKSSKEYNFLNRNYISHMMGKESFYSRNNAIKLVLLIDLLTFVIACSKGQNQMFWKSQNDEDYRRRYDYYYFLSTMAITKGAVESDKLLQEHNNFKGYMM